VGPHVPCNHVPPARGVRTRRALVRLLPGVSSLVCREVVAARKHLVAHATGVRFEACVQTNMSCQHVAPCKASSTHLAEVRLGLGGAAGLHLVRLVS